MNDMTDMTDGGMPMRTLLLIVATHPDIAPGTYALDGSDIPDAAVETAVAALWPVLVGQP